MRALFIYCRNMRFDSHPLQEWELKSPIHIAAYSGNVAKLEELLKDSECKTLTISLWSY